MKTIVYVLAVSVAVVMLFLFVTYVWYACWNFGLVPAVSWARHITLTQAFWLMLCGGVPVAGLRVKNVERR